MKFEIVEKMENPLLNRVEVRFKVDHQDAATPKRSEIKSHIAAALNASEELVVIEKMASLPGKQEASGLARVYGSKGRLEAMEPGHLLKRGLPKEEKEAKEKPKEEKKPEEKTEEKKGEKPEKREKGEKPPEGKPKEKPGEKKPEGKPDKKEEGAKGKPAEKPDKKPEGKPEGEKKEG